MYPVIPVRWYATGLTLVVAAALYADKIIGFLAYLLYRVALSIGGHEFADKYAYLQAYEIQDQTLIRFGPLLILALFSVIFGTTGRLAPWRIIWRRIPILNRRAFPDLNGIWVGSTSSNWPTLCRMLQAAQSTECVTEDDLYNEPNQNNAIALKIEASLFRISISAALSSTAGQSYSITAKPWFEHKSGRLHVSYVYEQKTPNPTKSDEECHVGAAELIFELEDLSKAEGTYWTRRKWRAGLNTAGMLNIQRLDGGTDKIKTLHQYALDEQLRMQRSSTN